MNASGDIGHMDHPMQWSIGASVLMIVAGILAIILPEISSIAVTFLVAWLLLFSGVAHFVYAWNARHGDGNWWEVLTGVIYCAAGLYILFYPTIGLATLTIVLGIYLLLECIFEFFLAFYLRRQKGSGWLAFDGVITLVLAALILRSWQQSALWVIGTLVGISMLFSGIARLVITLTVRHHEVKPA